MTTQSPFSKQASLAGNSRGNWVRLRTLVALRWLAISGQIAAVLIASQFLNLNLRLDLCTLAIAASVLFNIVALATNPANKRLNEVSIGIVFVAVYARRITVDNLAMSQALSATQMALAREQQLTALGGVVAAAAHELGTPLATIKLVSTELAEELKDHPDLLVS